MDKYQQRDLEGVKEEIPLLEKYCGWSPITIRTEQFHPWDCEWRNTLIEVKKRYCSFDDIILLVNKGKICEISATSKRKNDCSGTTIQ